MNLPFDLLALSGAERFDRSLKNDSEGQRGFEAGHSAETFVMANMSAALIAQEKRHFGLGEPGAASVSTKIVWESGREHGKMQQDCCTFQFRSSEIMAKKGKLAASDKFARLRAVSAASAREYAPPPEHAGQGAEWQALTKRWRSVVCSRMKFIRRLGPDPHAAGAQTEAAKGCPDILELETGDFAIIGRDITTDAASQLPSSASCGPDERVVVIPRRTLVGAKADIPDAV